MRNFLYVAFAIVAATGLSVLFGCGQSELAHPAAEEANPGHSIDTSQAEIDAVLATLSDADQQAARAQQICPVSNEPLGSMGAPIKVNLSGQDVFICCEGCEDALRADPKKFLVMLPPQG